MNYSWIGKASRLQVVTIYHYLRTFEVIFWEPQVLVLGIQLTIIVISLGIAGFALTSFLKSKASKKIDKIDLAYLQLVNNLFQVNGFVVSVTSGLEIYQLSN
jgi:hypothetical protein